MPDLYKSACEWLITERHSVYPLNQFKDILVPPLYFILTQNFETNTFKVPVTLNSFKANFVKQYDELSYLKLENLKAIHPGMFNEAYAYINHPVVLSNFGATLNKIRKLLCKSFQFSNN